MIKSKIIGKIFALLPIIIYLCIEISNTFAKIKQINETNK